MKDKCKKQQKENKERQKGVMKTIDERQMQKTKEKQTKTENSKGNRSYSERMRAKLFCCAFKLG